MSLRCVAKDCRARFMSPSIFKRSADIVIAGPAGWQDTSAHQADSLRAMLSSGNILLHGFRLPIFSFSSKSNMKHLPMVQHRTAEIERAPAYDPRFAAVRTRLCRILSVILNKPHQDINMTVLTTGRPGLAGEDASVSFSLSYYQSRYCVIALCRGARIGADIQFLNEHRLANFRWLFDDFLSRREQFFHPGLTEAEIWVRMEAFSKMTGQGLEAGLRRLFSIATGLSVSPIACSFSDFRLAGIAGAVCTEGVQVRQIRLAE